MAGWIGIDLGATWIRIAALGDAGGMHRIIPTPAPHALKHFVHAIRDAVILVGIPLSVGLARAPGIDSAGVICSWPSRTDWLGVPLLDIIRNHTGKFPHHMDDGTAAASWESADARHAGKTAASVVIGTGLAIGCAQNGIPMETGNGAYTPAHEHVEGWDAPCRCGKCGCLQTMLSGGGLLMVMAMNRAHALKIVGVALENAGKSLCQRYGAEQLVISGNILLNPEVKAFLVESLSHYCRENIIFSAVPQVTVIGGALLAAAIGRQFQEGAINEELPELHRVILSGLMRHMTA